MIELFGHQLIEFNSSILKYHPNTFLAHKCIKCNHIIFTNKYRHLADGLYWKYPDGSDFNAANGYGNWQYIELTCEEEIIKNLLE